MKIKSIGFMTFLINFESITLITDPFSLSDVGIKLGKTEIDVLINTQDSYVGKLEVIKNSDLSTNLVPLHRENVFEINNFGEYEIGGVMFRKPNMRNYVVIDQDYIRVVYLGFIGNDFNPDFVKNIGEVDVLIAPIGDGNLFPSYSKIQKIVANIDPTYLIPCGYKTDGMSGVVADSLKPSEDFLKEAGYSNVRTEKELKVADVLVKEEKTMEVVLLN